MKISVVMPNYNTEKYIEQTIRSIVAQRKDGIDMEYIVYDGASKDRSLEIIEKYRKDIDLVISEPDKGAPDAINKGLAKASGDILCWLNSDDIYHPGTLKRVIDAMSARPEKALCFGHCPMMDENGAEIRKKITLFKEMFFPFSSRFLIQCINYVSQPAMFFRRSAFEKAGYLRTDLINAWDYDILLRLWKHGGAFRIKKPALSSYRWTAGSLSGRHYKNQFREEWEIAVNDAGKCTPQALIHLMVRWGIVSIYSMMMKEQVKGKP